MLLKMTNIPIQKIFMALMIVLFCLWGVWFAVIPESLIAGYIEKSFGKRGIEVEMAGLKKGVFGTVHVERVFVSRSSRRTDSLFHGKDEQNQTSAVGSRVRREGLPLLTVQGMDIAPDPFSFFRLSPRLHFSGKMGRGIVRGEIVRKWGGVVINIHAADLPIDDLTVFKRAGIYGEGTLLFNFEWRDQKGNIKFSIDHARLKGSLPGINALPLALIQSVKGMIDVGALMTVHSLTLEGSGVYVRVKGNIKASNFNGRLELMLNPSSDHYELLQAVMARYRQSPGYYLVPDVHADLLSVINQ